MWYYKINEIVELNERQLLEQQEMNHSLRKIIERLRL